MRSLMFLHGEENVINTCTHRTGLEQARVTVQHASTTMTRRLLAVATILALVTCPSPQVLRLLSKAAVTPHGDMPQWLESHDRRLLTGPVPVDDAVIVSIDGTGDHKTIAAAIAAAPPGSARHTIYVKKGVYKEKVDIIRSNIYLVGDGPGLTVITGNIGKITTETPCTATLYTQGDGFMARDLTIENTAGPEAEQAVAFASRSNRSALYHCHILGFQDTLLADANLQFYSQCRISATVDVVFGTATALFQDCVLILRRSARYNVLTAQGRDRSDDLASGFVFQGCNVTTDEDLNGIETFLGRPWRDYSRVVFLQCYMDAIVHPAGWVLWNRSSPPDHDSTKHVFYGEYQNKGPGASLSQRVSWPGFHSINDADEAQQFTADAFIHGAEWLPQTGVPYRPGL
ncbi:hypothetical protein ACP4OV_002155 [Aristida adscensionis]